MRREENPVSESVVWAAQYQAPEDNEKYYDGDDHTANIPDQFHDAVTESERI